MELVLPCGKPAGPEGGRHEPAAAAGGGGQGGKPRHSNLYLTLLDGRADILKRLIANFDAALQHGKAAAEQFRDIDRWGCMLPYISQRIAPVIGPPKPPLGLPANG
jgi:hypothetical protein